ncbi:uncharacterized protein LOC103314282 isoform X2 [Tribolium castaneum]|uniref:uncharacterized protein LOC103314282 isoform X2 n=1 Tax=Tribolium castaneum TaxID=7070 RepID=UPI00046BF21F|nr:PREDICTED: uncharacterized protein LOC103314282 isoform X2 [Tribolium castaneum]|eukprot:XP_008198115.1 PREDICTED: uncharacterized protein LOC103314282 isoform X2 [Tribolium castaneum]
MYSGGRASSEMGLPGCKWFVISVCCMTGIYGYSIRPIDENGQPINLDRDFLFTYDTRQFLDSFEDREKEMVDGSKFEATKPPGADDAENRMFLFFVNNDKYTGGDSTSTPLDSWSVVWYIASFGGLIVFFLIVSCSEWCCRRALRNSQSCGRSAPAAAAPSVPDTPPPSYDQFAPPSYESICLGRNGRGGEKSEYDIYVVPVHAFGTIMESRQEDAPPSYFSASGRSFVPAVTESNQVSRVT